MKNKDNIMKFNKSIILILTFSVFFLFLFYLSSQTARAATYDDTIFFIAPPSGETQGYDVYSINKDGSNLKKITNFINLYPSKKYRLEFMSNNTSDGKIHMIFYPTEALFTGIYNGSSYSYVGASEPIAHYTINPDGSNLTKVLSLPPIYHNTLYRKCVFSGEYSVFYVQDISSTDPAKLLIYKNNVLYFEQGGLTNSQAFGSFARDGKYMLYGKNDGTIHKLNLETKASNLVYTIPSGYIGLIGGRSYDGTRVGYWQFPWGGGNVSLFNTSIDFTNIKNYANLAVSTRIMGDFYAKENKNLVMNANYFQLWNDLGNVEYTVNLPGVPSVADFGYRSNIDGKVVVANQNKKFYFFENIYSSYTEISPGFTSYIDAFIGLSPSQPVDTGSFLNVTKSGTGTGTVTSSPAGINCGSTCSFNYNQGDSVTLTAASNPGSLFNGWTGCDSTSGALPNQTCNISMNSSSKNVTANFILNPLTINFTASTLNPPYNGSSTLSWTVANANSCSIDQGIGGITIPNSSRVINNIITSKTYTMTCTGAAGTKTASVTITPQLPPASSASMKITPTIIRLPGLLTNYSIELLSGGNYKIGYENNKPSLRVGDKINITSSLTDITGTPIIADNYKWTLGSATIGTESSLNNYPLPTTSGEYEIKLLISGTRGGTSYSYTRSVKVKIPKIRDLK
uniref:Bacterial repeat domain-containing protein n=1 Tax=candidate division CPR3 bacterium TaxID=2268181 RepID=A0A7C4LZV7_UNCC3